MSKYKFRFTVKTKPIIVDAEDQGEAVRQAMHLLFTDLEEQFEEIEVCDGKDAE